MEAQDRDDPVMYLVVRTSLGMGTGKTAAQVGHAVGMLTRLMEQVSRNPDAAKDKERRLAEEWYATDYAKIVLAADEKEFAKASALGPPHVTVVDNGRTEITAGSLTVVGFWPMRRSAAPSLLKRLRLLK
jgi:peptidyl-tRNA hydrolase